MSTTLSHGDRSESRPDALFPVMLDQTAVCPDAICSANPENLTPLRTSAMYLCLCILKRIQMGPFNTLKKKSPSTKPFRQQKALGLQKMPSKGQRTSSFVWSSHSKLKSVKSFGVWEFWHSLKAVKLKDTGYSRLTFTQKTKTLPVPKPCQKTPSFWEAMKEALHQASKTAHKALLHGTCPSHWNKWAVSHLKGIERWLAADCIVFGAKDDVSS